MGRNAKWAKDRYEPTPCVICGEVFTPTRKNQVCCSDLCRYKRHRRQCAENNAERREYDRNPIKCAVCGEEFIPLRNNQVCCSDTCRGAWIAGRKRMTNPRQELEKLEERRAAITTRIEKLKERMANGEQ